MILRITSRAEGDIAAILSYIMERSPLGASRVGASIRQGLDFIAAHPTGGQRVRPSVRVKILTDYPYKIFYRLNGEFIEIVHVRHTSRRQWFG